MINPQLQRGDQLRALDDGTRFTVTGTPWFNKSDAQWYYPITDSIGNDGDITDAEVNSGQIERLR